MNTARIVVLTIALSAGGVAAYLASGSDSKPPPTEPVAQLQTVEVLMAKADIGLGQTLTPNDMQWQTWPASTASNTFIRRNDRPDATTQIAGSIARAPLIAGEPIREAKLVKADGALDQAPKERDGQNSAVGKTATFEWKPEQTSILAAAQLVRYGVSTPTILK